MKKKNIEHSTYEDNRQLTVLPTISFANQDKENTWELNVSAETSDVAATYFVQLLGTLGLLVPKTDGGDGHE